MKRPSLQFYVGDWMKDPALRAVSFAARGLWMDLLCLMFESPERGCLKHANGRPVTPEQLARMTGGTIDEVRALLQELDDCGVYSVRDDGVIFSRRMVRDEELRAKRAECGGLGAEFGHLGAEHGQKGAQYGRLGGRPPKNSPPPDHEIPGMAAPETPGETGGETPGKSPGITPSPSSSSSSSLSSSPSSSDSPSGGECAADAAPPLQDDKRRGERPIARPTLADAIEYCSEKGLTAVDPETWFLFYKSNGWKVGKGPMKDWKACIAKWDREERRKNPSGPPRTAASGRRDGFRGDFLLGFGSDNSPIPTTAEVAQ